MKQNTATALKVYFHSMMRSQHLPVGKPLTRLRHRSATIHHLGLNIMLMMASITDSSMAENRPMEIQANSLSMKTS